MSEGNSAIRQIGKYRVIRELGRGATSVVYLADDSFNNRSVAIKAMSNEALQSAEDGDMHRKMFLNEASLAGKMTHPHIVAIFDAVVDENMSYIVMEYAEGGTLEKYCKPDSLLEPQTVAEIIFKCVRALAYANSKGLIHRDVKPGNILYTASSSKNSGIDSIALPCTRMARARSRLPPSPMPTFKPRRNFTTTSTRITTSMASSDAYTAVIGTANVMSRPIADWPFRDVQPASQEISGRTNAGNSGWRWQDRRREFS